MRDVIIDRCCGNCEWSISPILEDEIMKENSYDEDDPTRPRAGDCCLGVEHDDNYFCNHHTYITAGLETYAFYDEEEAEPGYYVVTEYYDNIIRYFKLYRTGEYGNYNYGIRAYEINPITSDCGSVGICFEVSEFDNKDLYKVFGIFAKELGNNVIWSFEDNNNGFLTASDYKDSVSIDFSKVIKKNDNNFIDIKVKCDKENRNYRLIEHLFRNMAVATLNKKNVESLKKVRKITR